MKRPLVQTKPLYFVGSARKDLKSFPSDVQDEIGNALLSVQWGGVPHRAKPMKGFGGVSVMEIAQRYDTNTFRAIYTVKFEHAVYVLHCFQKKSKRGIATTQQDIDLVEQRLKFAQALYRQFEKNSAGD